MTIIYGILGLSLIVLVHEAGHMIAARISGVKVESFSIGMGPILLHKTINGTDYRISLIPIGGYCGMKGETAFQEACENNLDSIQGEEDSFYGVHPLKRAFIAFSGPFFNVLFAVVAFSIIAMVGYDYTSSDNRIILADEYYSDIESPASESGMLTGDRIISINGVETPLFTDISQFVSLHGDEDLVIVVERNGELLSLNVHSLLDKSTGAGKIGITDWVDPTAVDVEEGSPADIAGLIPGDRITSINGNITDNLLELHRQSTESNGDMTVTYIRNNTEYSTILHKGDAESLGLLFQRPIHHTEVYSLFPAIWEGIKETADMISATLKSITLLFKGIDITKAVSGPARITQMLGETAEIGFKEGFSTGLVTVLNFLSLISVSLFIMNLLPIPVLDGGLILFALIQFIRRRQIKPKILYYIQFVGIGFIVILFAVALFSDINYFITR